MTIEHLTPYDSIADVYDVLWGKVSTQRYLTAILAWLKDTIAPGSSVLDLACGTGQLAAALSSHNFEVSGIDVSSPMIEIARARAPDVHFTVGNAIDLPFPSASFSAVVSLFDSLNHLTPPELSLALAETARVLTPGGMLLFDLNTDEGFKARWRGSSAEVREDLVCTTRAHYDHERGEGEYLVTVLRPRASGMWSRTDTILREWVHPQSTVVTSLTKSGFENIKVVASDVTLGLSNDLGRLFYYCRKSSNVGR